MPKVAGLDLGQFGIALAVFSAWSALGNIFDPAGGFNNSGQGSGGFGAGTGVILALIATLALAGAAVATPLVPALKGALIGAPRPQAPQPYGAQPAGGYGYPGAQQPGQPYGAQPGQPGQPYGAAQPQQQAAPAPQAAQAPAGDFSPFWFAVPVPRPLYAEDGSPTPIAELAPGTWYLAVEQRGPGLVAQTQDGRRGVLQDTTGISAADVARPFRHGPSPVFRVGAVVVQSPPYHELTPRQKGERPCDSDSRSATGAAAPIRATSNSPRRPSGWGTTRCGPPSPGAATRSRR